MVKLDLTPIPSEKVKLDLTPVNTPKKPQKSFMGNALDSIGTFSGAADKAILNALNAPTDLANWGSSKLGLGRPFENLTDVPTTLANKVTGGNMRTPTQIADQGTDFKNHPIAGLAGAITGVLPAFVATDGLTGTSALPTLEEVTKAADTISPAATEALQHLTRVGKQAIPFTKASNAAKLAKTTTGLEHAGRLALQGGLAGALTANTGDRLSGAKFGAAAGALSPIGAKLLNVAARPVVGAAASDFTKKFAKKMATYIKPDWNKETGSSFLENASRKLKDIHDNSKQKYQDIYNSAKVEGENADKILNTEKNPFFKKFPGAKNAIFPTDFMKRAGKKIMLPIMKKYNISEDEANKKILPMFDNMLDEETGDYRNPRGFADLVNLRRRAVNFTNRGGDDPVLRTAIDEAKSKFRNLLDEYGKDVSSKSTVFRKPWETYLRANKAFANHAERFRKLPSKKLAGKLVTNKPLTEILNNDQYDELGNKIYPDSNLIEDYFTPQGRSTKPIEKLGDMLGDKEYAKDLIKTSLYDQYVRNGLAKPGMLNHYEKMPEQIQDMLFSPGQNAIIRAASKIKANPASKKIARVAGHYSTAGLLGGLAGEATGHGFGKGALAGLALEGAGDALGTALTQRMLRSDKIEQIEKLVNRHLLNPVKAQEAITRLANGTHVFVSPKQVRQTAIGTKNG